MNINNLNMSEKLKRKMMAEILKGKLKIYQEIEEGKLESVWFSPGKMIAERWGKKSSIWMRSVGKTKVMDSVLGKTVYEHDEEKNGGFILEVEDDSDWKRVLGSERYEVVQDTWFELKMELPKIRVEMLNEERNSFSHFTDALRHLLELDIDEKYKHLTGG